VKFKYFPKDGVWGTVSMVDGFYHPDGHWIKGCVHGYIRLTIDKELGEGFRSTEKWQLWIYANSTVKQPAMIIPGCKVRTIVFWPVQEETYIPLATGDIFDARKFVQIAERYQL